MPKVNCAVVGCSSNTYGINKWKTVKDLIVFTVFQPR